MKKYESFVSCLSVLELYGVAEAATGSPREMFKAVYKLGWLEDDNIWLDMLKKRYIAIHVYDEECAAMVMVMIFNRYISALQTLRDALQRKLMDAD